MPGTMNVSQLQTNDSSNDRCLNGEIHKLPSFVVELAIALAGIMANFLIIISHIKDPLKIFKTPSSSFVLNIAVVDITASFVMVIKTLTEIASPCFTLSQRNSDILMRAWIIVSSISPASYLSLSIERFCSVVFPLWHRVHISTRVCHYWLGTLWLVHLCFEGLVTSLVSSVGDVIHLIIILLYTGSSFCCTQIFYLSTFVSLRKQRKKLFTNRDVNEATSRTTKIRLENEKHFLCTIAIVCFVMAFTLLPTFSFLIIRLFRPNFGQFTKSVGIVLDLSMAILLISNFAVNPFVYLWRLPKYRRTFKVLYGSFFEIHTSSTCM